MDRSGTEGQVQAWAKVRGRTRHTGQARVEERRKAGGQTSEDRPRMARSDQHREEDATGRAIGPETGPRTESIAERRRTKSGVGEERGKGKREMRTYCTKAAVSGTSLYGSRPRPRVSARPEEEERRWLPEPDAGEGRGHIHERAELWSAEHGEGGRLLRRVRSRRPWRAEAEAEGGRESWSRSLAELDQGQDAEDKR
ncbi:hypothetical protein DFH06DRAFT_1139759 [Mycena polygramma]|nr:hypothetical protein DFH06DRAFT_1139759 [Mycena polygramma]